MLREQINIHVRPAWEYFSRCCVVAHEMIEADNVPAWFREQFDHGEFIEQEYALPSKVLLIFALALELSFEMPSAEALTGFKSQLKDAQVSLKKTRAALLALRDFPLMPLGPATLGHRETPDGLLEFKHGPDPTDEIVEAIDNYLEQLKLVRIGRKTSAVPHAVRKVNSFVDRHNPELTSTRRQDLCHYLFDKTRERHGQHSRSPTRDDDDMPRFRDLFSKRSTRPRRKISKKEG